VRSSEEQDSSRIEESGPQTGWAAQVRAKDPDDLEGGYPRPDPFIPEHVPPPDPPKGWRGLDPEPPEGPKPDTPSVQHPPPPDPPTRG
jgi:hypothetical protein